MICYAIVELKKKLQANLKLNFRTIPKIQKLFLNRNVFTKMARLLLVLIVSHCHFPYPFSDMTLYVIKHSICISTERSQRNKDEYAKLTWNDTFYLFLFSLTSYSPRLLGRKISL